MANAGSSTISLNLLKLFTTNSIMRHNKLKRLESGFSVWTENNLQKIRLLAAKR